MSLVLPTASLAGIDAGVRVLALDVATATGAAWDGPEGRPLSATHVIGGVYGPRELGARCKDFVAWLHGFVRQCAPGLLAVEAPLPVAAQDNNLTARLLITMVGMVHLVGASRGLPVVERDAQAIKRHFTGDRLASKLAVQKMCELLGWHPASFDEADAMALWALVRAEIDPKFSIQTAPLFAPR